MTRIIYLIRFNMFVLFNYIIKKNYNKLIKLNKKNHDDMHKNNACQ